MVNVSGIQVGGQLNISPSGWKEADTIHTQGAVKSTAPMVRMA
jgi:hypothetical protein